jgi:hypothetical protein
MDRLASSRVEAHGAMKTPIDSQEESVGELDARRPMRRKLAVAPFLRATRAMGEVRALSAASTTSTGYPTALALHTALLVSGALVACGSPEAGDAIHADEHVRTVATAVKTQTSASTQPATMAQPFVEPDPHEVDGQRMVVVPPPLPSATVITTAPTTTTLIPTHKLGGARPPIRPHPLGTSTTAGGASPFGTPPCPPRDPGAST